jgi:5-methylcytosine-specific restriction protein B
MLQVPPQGDGRYLCAGRYVAAAHELGIPINHLTTILNQHDPMPYGYWRIGTSAGEKPRDRWLLMRDGACVAIGWPDLGNLSGYEKDSQSRKKLIELVGQRYPGAPQQVGRSANQVFNFVRGIDEGDVVLACDGSTVLGIGRVGGEYRHEPGSDFPHRRPVKWLSQDEWKMPEPEGLQTTVHRLKKFPVNLVEAEKRSLGPPPPNGNGDEWPPLQGIPGRIQSVLERKSQVILYGPPGTGKTF